MCLTWGVTLIKSVIFYACRVSINYYHIPGRKDWKTRREGWEKEANNLMAP